jgi:hypothetical protein
MVKALPDVAMGYRWAGGSGPLGQRPSLPAPRLHVAATQCSRLQPALTLHNPASPSLPPRP